ncbi:hypothetical protein ABXN37_15485, partial [Piscinibacter sakaiensis]|uniref:hypothetical protein n=1 Tax=Piscinibacter sakaiensis TaxID=1547922 RepID=UPI001E5B5177
SGNSEGLPYTDQGLTAVGVELRRSAKGSMRQTRWRAGKPSGSGRSSAHIGVRKTSSALVLSRRL